MNDSLRTNVFVRFSPDKIACACIYLAARKFQVFSIFCQIFVMSFCIRSHCRPILDGGSCLGPQNETLKLSAWRFSSFTHTLM